MEERGEEIDMGDLLCLGKPGIVLKFEEDRDGELCVVEVSSMEEGPFFEEFFSVISCDGDDRFFVEILFFEKRKKTVEELIDIGDGISIAVFDRLNLFGDQNEVVELIGKRLKGSSKIFGEAVFRMG